MSTVVNSASIPCVFFASGPSSRKSARRRSPAVSSGVAPGRPCLSVSSSPRSTPYARSAAVVSSDESPKTPSSRSPRATCVVSAEPLLQRFELLANARREVVAELGEKLLHLRQLLLDQRKVDRQQLL